MMNRVVPRVWARRRAGRRELGEATVATFSRPRHCLAATGQRTPTTTVPPRASTGVASPRRRGAAGGGVPVVGGGVPAALVGTTVARALALAWLPPASAMA